MGVSVSETKPEIRMATTMVTENSCRRRPTMPPMNSTGMKTATLPYFGAKFGNAASGTHRFGWEAEGAVEVARQRIADLAGGGAREIVFTSGATESNNLALKGVVAASGVARAHIVTLATEHKS